MYFSKVKILSVCLFAALLCPASLWGQEPVAPTTPPDTLSTSTATDALTVEKAASDSKSRRKRKKEIVSVSEDFTADYKVSAGGRTFIPKRTPQSDSLRVVELTAQIDSLTAVRDSLAQAEPQSSGVIELDSLAEAMSAANRLQRSIDSLSQERTIYQPRIDSLSADKDVQKIDSAKLRPRYNAIFRDSLSFSLVTALSVPIPGFAQLYEGKYWKIPLEYAAIGAPLYFGIKQNKLYRQYSDEYNDLKLHNAEQSEITPVQAKMYRYDTYRTLLFGAAAAAYMGFLVDGIVNYPSELSRIQKATTLSMVCPGAGQVYNGSYWKVPIVVGGLATMFYVVDWNSRGYNRFKLAYQQVTDGDPSTVDEWNGAFSEKEIKNYKDLYRRNRDMAIIGLVGVYLVQVADAHIDAHMQAYDITDDLAMTVQPYINTISTRSGLSNNVGMSLALHF